MAQADSLVALFEAMTQNLEQDRGHLNSIDRGDGDAGDNMAANFRLITDTLAQTLARSGEGADVGEALAVASRTLRKNGQGATAPIYAQGLSEASKRLAGQTSFSLDDLLPLLEGLLSGSRKASGRKQGEGSLLDVLLPGIMAYVMAKRGGQSDLDAILTALLNLRRGANSTAESPTGYGRSTGKDTTGQVDPGAAGAASLLEGLFGAILRQAMQQGGGGLPGLGGASQPSSGGAGQPSAGAPKFPGRKAPDVQLGDDEDDQAAPLPLPGLPSGLGDLLSSLFGGSRR